MATKLYTQLRGGGEPVEEFPAQIITYGYRLNRPGSIKFVLALDHPKTRIAKIEAGVHEVVVERDDTVVWAGPLLVPDEDDTNRVITFEGEGLQSYLRKMHVTSTLTFTAATDDQFDIARALVDHHQAKAGGDFGIDTSAVTASGRKRDRTYHGYELKNVFDAVVELSEVEDGFDFSINPSTRALDLYYPRRGQRRSDIVFDERNIRKFRRRRDLTSQASQIYGVGAGEAEDMLIRSLQSSTAVAKYGLTQGIVPAKDVSEVQTLEDHVTSALDSYADVPNLISITVGANDPQLFTYQEGDEVKIVWDSPYERINEYQRVIGFDVTWTEGEEQAVLHLVPL